MAALGRCDLAHVAGNGLGIAVLFLAALSRTRWFKAGLVAYALVFIGYSSVLNYVYTFHIMQRALGLRAAVAADPRATARSGSFNGLYYSKLLPLHPSFNELLSLPGCGIPLGCDEGLERFLKLSNKLVFEYYMSPGMDVFQPGQLARKLADMEKMKYIVVPCEAISRKESHDLSLQARADSEYLSQLLLFPVQFRPKNEPFDAGQEIVREIKKHYTPCGLVGYRQTPYFVMKRN